VKKVMYRTNEKELVNLSRFYRFLVINADVGFEVIGYVNENSGYSDRCTLYVGKTKKECIEVLSEIEDILGGYYGKS